MRWRTDPFLTTQEVADVVGVTKRTLQNWLRARKIPEPERNPANRYRRWTLQDVERIREFLRERSLDQTGSF